MGWSLNGIIRFLTEATEIFDLEKFRENVQCILGICANTRSRRRREGDNVMKKNFLLCAAGLVISAVLFTGCLGITNSGENGPVTITVMGRSSDLAKSYMTSIFKQYEDATGNHIKPVPIEDTEFEAVSAERFANGEGTDIYLHFHNADLYRFDVEKNFIYLNDQKWVDELTDSTREYCLDSDGNLMGLPYWENSVSGCYYNKTILDSLGLKPATTQTEFDVLCQALANAGYVPICWPADGCSWMVQFALDPVFADDPEMLEKINENEITYADIPEVHDMMDWIGSAADRGWFGSDYLKCDINDISPIMSSGGAVMTFMWDTWFYTDLAKDGKYTVDDFALMPVFLNTVENGTYEGGNLNMMMVNKKSEHIDECLDFLSFCADEKNYNIAFDGISTVNCFKGQTTNIQSPMITNVSESIDANLRASTSASKITGFSGDDVAAALDRFFRKKTDAEGCIKLMDEYRIMEAGKQGNKNFK